MLSAKFRLMAAALLLSAATAVKAGPIEVVFTAQLSAIPGTAFVGGDDSGIDGATMTLSTTFGAGTTYQFTTPRAVSTNKWEMTLSGSAIDGTYLSSGNAEWIPNRTDIVGGNAYFGADTVAVPEFDIPIPGQAFDNLFRVLTEFTPVATPSTGDLLDVSHFGTALAPSNSTFFTFSNASNGQQYNTLNASLLATDLTSGATNHDSGGGSNGGGGSTSVPLPSTLWLLGFALAGIQTRRSLRA